jgi:hypothetical protein
MTAALAPRSNKGVGLTVGGRTLSSLKKKARNFKNTRTESLRLPRCPSPSFQCPISCVRPQATLCQLRQLLRGLVSAQAAELAASDFQTLITSSDSASIIGADYTARSQFPFKFRILGGVASYDKVNGMLRSLRPPQLDYIEDNV